MKKFPIVFAGAGPGDPELITVKGRNALESADRIVYAGSLVPEAVLKWARPSCERLNSAGMHLDEIMAAMTEGHEQGLRVVRLHTGDPSLYGAIAEQIAGLKAVGIPYEVIPGVTAAFAAAASLGIEYTLPEITQTLILTRMAGRTPVPEAEKLTSLARHGASMSIYLSIGMVEEVAEILSEAYGTNAPAAVAYRVSHPDERVWFTTVGKLAETVHRENIKKQALILVGAALEPRLQAQAQKSRLYDRDFTHMYRSGNTSRGENQGL